MGLRTETRTTVHWLPEGRGIRVVKGNRATHMVTEVDVTLGGGHAVQYTDRVSYRCTLETCMILLAGVTTINLILKKT